MPRGMLTATVNSIRTFTICTGLSCLLVLDYFLFSTGNPSLTYSLLGGWFEVTLIGFVTLTAVFCVLLYRHRVARQMLLWHIGVVCLLCVMLFMVSNLARNFAELGIRRQAELFMRSPDTENVMTSDEARRLMEQIGRQKFVAQFEGFIPTYRRVDYQIRTATGDEYNLIAIASWKETIKVSLQKVSGK